MNNRIKELRKCFKLTQVEFGQKIGVKGNTVTGYESGIRVPSDAVITLICREFGVNEKWLREGDGEMFRQYNSREAELWAKIGEIMKDDPDDLRRSFLEIIVRLDGDQLKVLAAAAQVLADANKKADD